MLHFSAQNSGRLRNSDILFICFKRVYRLDGLTSNSQLWHLMNPFHFDNVLKTPKNLFMQLQQMIFTKKVSKSSINFKSFKTRSSYVGMKFYIMEKIITTSPNKKSLLERGTVQHFCKSIISVNRQLIILYLLSHSKCDKFWFNELKKIWPHTGTFLLDKESC